MKNVLIMHYGGNQIRGSERCLAEAITALSGDGFRTVVMRNDPSVDPLVSPCADTVLDEPFPEIMFDGARKSFPLRRYLQSSLRLRRTIREHRPAMILCNGGLPCQLGVPAARRAGIPLLCHFHHPAPKRYLYLWLVRYADRLMFPSNFTRSVVLEKSGRDGAVVYNGIDTETRFVPATRGDSELRNALGIDPRAVVFGQVGHLSAHKRPDFLVRAFAAARKERSGLHLVLVGDGPMYAALEALVRELSLQDAVTLTGYVADVVGYYREVFDINVMASREEGLGISVIEASACALPSIVTDCTGLREVVDHGVNGLTFPEQNTGQLTRDMIELAENPVRRHTLGQAAREKAVQCFSLEGYRKGVLEQVRKTIES